MATGGAFLNGSGETIAFVVTIINSPTSPGGFAVKTDIDFANKEAMCNIYGQLIAEPADPVGQANFVAALADAIRTEAQSPGTPFGAQQYFSFPGMAEGFAYREATTGETRKACSWGEAFAPNTELSILINGTDANASSDARVIDPSSGALLGQRIGQGDGSHTDTFFDPENLISWAARTVEYSASDKVLADFYSYDTANVWSASHYVSPATWAGMNEGAITYAVSQIEREAFHGGAVY